MCTVDLTAWSSGGLFLKNKPLPIQWKEIHRQISQQFIPKMPMIGQNKVGDRTSN